MQRAKRIAVGLFTVTVLFATTAFERLALALERAAPPVSETAWELQGTVARGRQVYAVVDSVAFWVPFDNAAAAYDAGVHVRGGFGWTTHAHAHELWGRSQRTSFQDAASSPASMVFVGLGTNDIACMRGGDLCGDTYPRTVEERSAERAKWFAEVNGAVQLLASAGKCITWAGPREIDSVTAPLEEARSFNQMLRDLEARYSGSFHYVDYHRFSFDDPHVHAALDGPSGDRIHPYSQAASLAIADFALSSTLSRCSVEPAAPESCDGSQPRLGASPFGMLLPAMASAFWRCRRAPRKKGAARSPASVATSASRARKLGAASNPS